ncbi:hypothetical protein OsccyDRAFT_4273 [Leptolyngbyaceae cyanobacterium JSC-12]|nr:hypothetical protein OsccyDRAFT_4273 [Leptolyngbyaceae cyanobacterium JSC-12]
MKAEYDFSKGKRGKFYNPDAEFPVPIYLDKDVEQFLTQLSADQHIDIQALVNKRLRSNIRLIQSVQTVES